MNDIEYLDDRNRTMPVLLEIEFCIGANQSGITTIRLKTNVGAKIFEKPSKTERESCRKYKTTLFLKPKSRR